MGESERLDGDTPLKWEKRGHVGILTLNRPQALNAFDLEMMTAHRERLAAFEADEDLWVLVYTGEGRAFSAGVDVRKAAQFLEYSPEERFRLWATPASMRISKPSIAAVNGYAFGGGCELALGCDIRLAAEAAVFALPEVQLGAMPGGGGTQTLPRSVALGDAFMMMFTGQSVSAEEALRMRLVQKVVPGDRLQEEAVALAETICRNGQRAVRDVKQVVQLGLDLPLSEALWLEQIHFERSRMLAADDIAERLRAFEERRRNKPVKS